MRTTPQDLARGLQKLDGDQTPAFIAGLGSNGLGFLRSLGRRGVPVVALESWKDPGMYSRYCIPSVVPDPAYHEVVVLEHLQELGEVLPVRPVLLATSDAFILFVSKHQKTLANHFELNVADYDSVLTLANKRLQYEYAQERGIQTPETRYPSDEPIEEIARKMDYPCLIKPSFSHLWRNQMGGRRGKVAEVHSPAELIDTYGEVKESGLELMVQEKIPGGDDQLFGVLTYLNRSSEPRAVFTKRKLRQFPRQFGDGSLTVGVREPEVAELGLRLLQGLKFRGTASVEFKRDARDGEWKLMEMNPRSISQTYHAVRSGVDIPYIAYRDALGRSTTKATTFRTGVKWIDLAKDFKSLLETRREEGLDLGPWVRSLRGERCFATYARDDPLPAVLGLAEFSLATPA